MSIQEERDRLLQKEWRKEFIPQLGKKPWITAYINSFQDALNCKHVYMGFIPNRNIDAALESYNWDVHSFEFRPYYEVEHDYESKRTDIRYGRFGFPKFEIEPFVVERSFHGLRKQMIEVSEEYRMFHDLYFDKPSASFLKFDDAGTEIPVIKFSQNLVEARRKEIRQFLSAKNMSLVIYFEQMNASIYTLADLRISETWKEIRLDNCLYEFGVNDCRDLGIDNFVSRSWVNGKKIIKGLPLEQCGIWPFEQKNEHKHEEFIIGIDENDQPIICTPVGISHSAGKEIIDSGDKRLMATYLTPVFFKRSVLNKYYGEPSKYSDEDGNISCGDLWSLRIDNNHPEYVIALLGDLGRSLPAKEQAYWKSYNVPPDGGLSRTAQGRWIDAEWTDAEDSALRFKQAYEGLSRFWKQRFGWHLFKPLEKPDTHHFKMLHRPATNEPAELNEIAVSLSKLLPEAINDSELLSLIKSAYPPSKRSFPNKTFAVLKEYLALKQFDDSNNHVDYLEKVQMLRAVVAAHRTDNKPDAYNQVRKFFELDTKTIIQVADDIFTTLTDFLDSLREHFCPDESD